MIRGNTCTIDPPSDPHALIDFDPFEADAAAAPRTAPADPAQEQEPAPDRGCLDTSIGACPDHISSPTEPASQPGMALQVPDVSAAFESPRAPAPAPAEPSTPPTAHEPTTATPQPLNTATALAPEDLPENIQNQLFEAYLNSDQPATQIAEQAGITLIQFIRWQSHPYTRAIIADLERIATERAATQCTLAQPGAIHSLTLISTQTFDRPETARKASSLLTRLHVANEKRNTTPPPPAPRRNITPRKAATPHSHKSAPRPPKTKKADSRSQSLPREAVWRSK